MRLSSVALAALIPLAACVPAEPVVSEFNGDSVRVRVGQLSDEARRGGPRSQAEADGVCRTRGLRARYASTVPNDAEYYNEHLYLCV